ncbi:hypothetical protein A2U01_0059041, partial [Trifolium medium]|nr:hypothetical protein [Trifolium medium]
SQITLEKGEKYTQSSVLETDSTISKTISHLSSPLPKILLANSQLLDDLEASRDTNGPLDAPVNIEETAVTQSRGTTFPSKGDNTPPLSMPFVTP